MLAPILLVEICVDAGLRKLEEMSLGDRLGVAGLIVGLVALAAFYLWPEKKWVGSIALGVASISLIGWMDMEIRQRFGDNRASLWIAIAVGSIIGGSTGALLWYQPKRSSETSTSVTQSAPHNSGKLTPPEDLVILSGERIDRLIQIGDSGAMLKIDGPDGDVLKRFFGASHFVVERIDGRLNVSTDIRDSHGVLLGRLQRNQWETPQPGGRISDRNYTTDALEIVDAKQDVVLQIRLLSDRVQIQGKWYYSDGKRTLLMSPKYYPGYSCIVFAADPQKLDDPGFKIDPIFKYPSDRYLGILKESSPVIVKALTDVTLEGKVYVTQYEAEISGTIPLLSIVLKAATAKTVTIKDRRTGARVYATYKHEPGLVTASIRNARGVYAVKILTSKPDRVFIYHDP